MNFPIVPPPVTPDEAAPAPPQSRPRRAWRKWTLTLLAMVAVAFALLGVELGQFALIPFGLLLALSTGSAEVESTRSVNLTKRNLALAAVMVAGFGWSGCGTCSADSDSAAWAGVAALSHAQIPADARARRVNLGEEVIGSIPISGSTTSCKASADGRSTTSCRP